jgi:hypothetical protein
MAHRTSPGDRELVQALMLRGWYRSGYGPADASGLLLWRFRQGHCLDGTPGEVHAVRARTEREAMQAMLDDLEVQETAAKRAQGR